MRKAGNHLISIGRGWKLNRLRKKESRTQYSFVIHGLIEI
jgi:hypothetical protein